jgi:lipoate synthase
VSGGSSSLSPRKPAWLKRSLPKAPAYRATAGLLESLDLHTVCQEARCPNKGECYSSGTATFLILGDRCTRDCGFCSVGHGAPDQPDEEEPQRVAAAARRLGLRHVVVTSVTRDDLPDAGAQQFAATIEALRAEVPEATVEVLVPDFGGEGAALDRVLAARPDVLNHNLETVPRLYPLVRPAADYRRSLTLLRAAAGPRTAAGPRNAAGPRATTGPRAPGPRVSSCLRSPARRPQGASPDASQSPPSTSTASSASRLAGDLRLVVKTGLMVGLGEDSNEVHGVLRDCAAAGVDIVTVGQYLQPARDRLPVERYWAPEEFAELESTGAAMRLRLIAAPFVRSSYRAGELLGGIAWTAQGPDPRLTAAG